jgi:hypothetical protein
METDLPSRERKDLAALINSEWASLEKSEKSEKSSKFSEDLEGVKATRPHTLLGYVCEFYPCEELEADETEKLSDDEKGDFGFGSVDLVGESENPTKLTDLTKLAKSPKLTKSTKTSDLENDEKAGMVRTHTILPTGWRFCSCLTCTRIGHIMCVNPEKLNFKVLYRPVLLENTSRGYRILTPRFSHMTIKMLQLTPSVRSFLEPLDLLPSVEPSLLLQSIELFEKESDHRPIRVILEQPVIYVNHQTALVHKNK